MPSSSAAFLLVLTLLLGTASSDLEEDANSLISFITQVKLPRSSKYNWDISQHTCAWPGVGCGPDNFSVVILRLPGASLVGKIAPLSIGNITSLRVLSLHDNALSGPFPDDFANLSQLSHVYLHNNKFSGKFPSSVVTQWTLLEDLNLSNNNFSGRLPDNVVESSSKLVNFSVSNNKLSGPIPSSLARFPKTAFTGNFELCGKPLSNTCDKTKYPPSSLPTSESLSGLDGKKKKKKLSTGVIVAIAVGSGLFLLILVFCLGRKWSRAVKEKKAPGVATMAAAAAAKEGRGEVGTSSAKDDVTGASKERETLE